MPTLQPYKDLHPRIDPTVFLHEDTTVVGDVVLGPRVNLWPGVVLRGDQGAIVVGEETNLQDGVIAHATGGKSTVRVGARCTVGHRALLHGCVVGDDCLIGMGSILLDNCAIGDWTIIGAGSLVPVGKVIPSGVLALGSPVKVIRDLTEADLQSIRHGCATYLRLATEHGGPR